MFRSAAEMNGGPVPYAVSYSLSAKSTASSNGIDIPRPRKC